MKLIFLRHATAQDNAANDAARRLTDLGRQEARIAGQALAKLKVEPDAILSSPLVRARETAQITAEAMQFRADIGILQELTNEASFADLIKTLKTRSHAQELILVGHSPSMPSHVAQLIGADSPPSFAFGKGAVACVRITSLDFPDGELRWFLRQKQLRAIAGES